MLSASERNQLLIEWNQTSADYPQQQCIHQLFEAQVEKTPTAIAAIYEQTRIHYQELNRVANQLGHYLQHMGVRAESLVAVCLERSIETIVALLGIMKAGGAYLPLDPQYPQARLEYMLADSNARVLITERGLLERLPSTQRQVISIDEDWPAIAQ